MAGRGLSQRVAASSPGCLLIAPAPPCPAPVQLWCRLRLAFDHVRAFGDQEKAKVKNYVVFASNGPLSGMEAGAAALLAEQDALAVRTGSGGGGGTSTWDPAALDVLRGLHKAEVKFTFTRQRCISFLGLEEEARRAQSVQRAQQAGLFAAPGANLPPGAREAARREAQEAAEAEETAAAAAEAAAAPGSGEPPGPEELLRLMRQQRPAGLGQGGRQEPPAPPPIKLWAIERWKEEAARGHAMAAYHWAVMRRQLGDELWRAY